MNKKILVILFACVLLFSLAGLAFAVECSPSCDPKKEICVSVSPDNPDANGKCSTASLKDFFNDATCPGGCSCPDCQITSTDPSVITLTKNADLTNYRAAAGEITINLNGKRLEAPPAGGVQGDGNCKIRQGATGQIADCEFTGQGTDNKYGDIPIGKGNIKINDANGKVNIVCNGPAACTIDGVDFLSGATGTISKLPEAATDFSVKVETGQIQLRDDFGGNAECKSGGKCSILLPNGDTVASGTIVKIEGTNNYYLGFATTLQTKYGERITTSSYSRESYIYYPRGYSGNVDPACLSGNSACIIFGKDEKLTLTGQGIKLNLFYPPRAGGEIKDISFMPKPGSRCDDGLGCLMVRQYREEDRNQLGKVGPLGQMNVDSNGETVFIGGQRVSSSGSPFLGIDAKSCVPDSAGDCRSYRLYAQDGTCFDCSTYAGLETETNTNLAATSFFNFVGKAWGWITGGAAGGGQCTIVGQVWNSPKEICLNVKMQACIPPGCKCFTPNEYLRLKAGKPEDPGQPPQKIKLPSGCKDSCPNGGATCKPSEFENYCASSRAYSNWFASNKEKLANLDFYNKNIKYLPAIESLAGQNKFYDAQTVTAVVKKAPGGGAPVPSCYDKCIGEHGGCIVRDNFNAIQAVNTACIENCKRCK